MFTNVSFSVTPSARGCIVSETTGGWRPTTVKNEIGASLATPLWDTVLTHAIARGATLLTLVIAVPLLVSHLGQERYGLWATLSSVMARTTQATLPYQAIARRVAPSPSLPDQNAAISKP